MRYKPYGYQSYGKDKIVELTGVGAFLDMGLGKTAMTLTAVVELFKSGEVKKVLIIAPKKVVENVWQQEADKWDHLQHLKIGRVLGSEKERRKALEIKTNIFSINRENVVWLVGLYGNSWPFDMVVVDEMSSFKSHDSKRFKALRLVRDRIKRIVALTGTPAPNGLLDLWSQLYLLDKGERLGKTYTSYRDKFFGSDKRNRYTVFSYKIKQGDELLGENFYEKEIMDKIGDICFSMKTEDYIELPERLDNDQFIVLSPDMKKKYLDFEKEQVLKIAEGEITAVNAAALTNKLLQFANGCVYDEDKFPVFVHDEKMERLEELLEELNGEPVLLFYSFISDKDRIMRKFKKARVLRTEQDVKDWNDKKIELFVAHPASAGHGLNLQYGGNNMIWFGCPWSLELYQQAIKRIHRPGITKPVVNTRLIVRDTIEEDVIMALNNKTKMQDAVIRAVKARIAKYI